MESAEKSGDAALVADAWLCMGTSLIFSNQYETALSYFKKAQESYKQLNKDLEISRRNLDVKLLLAGLILLAGFTLLLFNRHRLKVRAHKQISEKNKELEQAHEEIRSLGGLLPICSSCKSIRDDEGYWHQVEVYIRDRSDADFSHGMCPGCVEKLYPGLDDDEGEEGEEEIEVEH